MKKFIVIVIWIISSMSFYGRLDSEGEKIADMQELINYENAQEIEAVQEEQTNEKIDKQKAEEILEEQKEITYQTEKSENVNEKQEIAVKAISNENKQAKEEKQENQEKTNTVKQQEKQVVTNENIQDTKQEIKENVKTEETQANQKKQCTNGKHVIETGNSNQWYKTEQEAIELYDKLQKEWSDKLRSGATTNEEYDQNCPYGYEMWDCPNCHQWTINFYYR